MSGAHPVGLDVPSPPEAWAACGFAVGQDGTARVGDVVLRLGAPAAGWTLAGADGEGDVDGIPTARVPVARREGAPPRHPVTAVAVDHVVVMTPDFARTVRALEAVGMTLRRERTAGTPERPIRQGFFRHGEAIVELGGPPEPAGDGPAVIWGMTFTVADIDAAAALLGDRLGAVRDAVQPGRRIATVRREAGLGLPVALMTA